MKIAIFGKMLSWQAPHGEEPVEPMPPSVIRLQAAVGGVTTAMLLVVAGSLLGAAWWTGHPAVMPARPDELADSATIPWGTIHGFAIVLGVLLFALTAAVARRCLPAARWLIGLTLAIVLAISLASPAHPAEGWLIGLAVVLAEITVAGLQRAVAAPRAQHPSPPAQPAAGWVADASDLPHASAMGAFPAIADTEPSAAEVSAEDGADAEEPAQGEPVPAQGEPVPAQGEPVPAQGETVLLDVGFDDADNEGAAVEIDEACDQAIWRSFVGPEGDVLRALLRCRLHPRQRTGTVHVGFCPPFRTIPEISIRTVDGSLARLTVAEKLAWGARVDVRLPEECSEATCCVLELIAQVPTD